MLSGHNDWCNRARGNAGEHDVELPIDAVEVDGRRPHPEVDSESAARFLAFDDGDLDAGAGKGECDRGADETGPDDEDAPHTGSPS